MSTPQPSRSPRLAAPGPYRGAAGVVSLILAACVGAGPVAAQGWDYDDYDDPYAQPGYGVDPGALSTRVWLDRGDDPVLERGERARLYYRTSHDAFISIFHIDTNGTVRLMYPRSPEENHYVRGGRDFRLVFPESSYWRVTDDPGVGYFFAVASPEPFDFRDFRYSPYAGGWDLSSVGRRVFSDPYVAMDEFVARLIPDWDVVPYALDFVSYHVEQRYEYPRFLCYDCHGFRPYVSWNPYLASCTSFRVVVYSDPYYYPATRYRGTRVVFVRPSQPGLPRFEFKERARGEAAAPLVVERGAVPRPSGGSVGADRRGAPVPSALPGSGVGSRTGAPGVSPLPERGRPSAVLPGRGGSAAPPATATPRTPVRSGSGSAAPSTRPTLERRPPATRTTPPAAGRSGGGGTSPPVPVRRGGGGGDPTPPAARPPTRSSGGGSAARAPTRSSGGGSAARPPTRSSGGGSAARAPTRSSGGGGAVRAPTRSSGGGSAARAPTRSSGGGSARAPTRSSGAGAARVPTRRSGGGGAAPPPTRRGGGG